NGGVTGAQTVYSERVEAAARPHARSRPRVLRIFSPAGLLALAAILVGVVLALELTTSHEYIFLPDKAHPVSPLVSVAGGHTQAGKGGIFFVDVVVRKATLLEQLF